MTSNCTTDIKIENDSIQVESQNAPDINENITGSVRENKLKFELERLVESEGDSFTVKVKNLVDWAGYQRRRGGAEIEIDRILNELNLISKPDFRNSHISADVEIGKISLVVDPAATKTQGVLTTIPSETFNSLENDARQSEVTVNRNDHILTVGRLEAANIKPISVKPDNELLEATTLMLKYNFSQLPVMQSDREVKGVVSWRSIVSAQLKGTQFPKHVSECMEKHTEVGYEDSLFDVFGKFLVSDYVLVKKSDKTISGIVTPFDLSEQFKELSEAFIKIGQIEAILRLIIETYYPIEKIKSAKDPADELREIKSVDDLTFGEYKRLLENQNDWSSHFHAQISRKVFIDTLEEIRLIRNEVMHFDPDGVDEKQHTQLSTALDFFNEVKKLLPVR